MKMSHVKEAISSTDFVPVMNKPVRYINRNMILKSEVDLTLLKGMYKDKEYVVSAIKKLEYDLRMIKNMDLFSAFNYFRKVIGYDEYINKQYQNDSKGLQENRDILGILQQKMKEFDSIESLENHAMQMQDIQDKNVNTVIEDNGLYLMTYHASKGLEFDAVFLPLLIEGEIPSKNSITLEEIEEERRMLYVAMTRAKKKLTLSYTSSKGREKHIRSRFIEPILKKGHCIIC